MDSKITARLRTRRRGAAMIEFAILLPFLALILALVLFFGHNMTRKGQVVSTNRHFAWRHARHLPDPMTPNSDIDYAQINRDYLDGQTTGLSMSRGHHAPSEDREGLAQLANSKNDEAGAFARDVIFSHFPGDVGYRTHAVYPADTVGTRYLDRDMGDRFYREGDTWQHKYVSIWHQVRDHYIEDFDLRMRQQNTTDAQLVHVVRNLYLRRW